MNEGKKSSRKIIGKIISVQPTTGFGVFLSKLERKRGGNMNSCAIGLGVRRRLSSPSRG